MRLCSNFASLLMKWKWKALLLALAYMKINLDYKDACNKATSIQYRVNSLYTS